jgi:hypothetical protein
MINTRIPRVDTITDHVVFQKKREYYELTFMPGNSATSTTPKLTQKKSDT